MKRFFDMENGIYVFMEKVSKLIVLNALWILCSLPIVTIGASTSALYYCTLKIRRKEDDYVWKMFFYSFRQNLRQGIFLTLFFLGTGVLLAVDLYICILMETPLGSVLTGIFLMLALILLMIFSYAFPFLAQFENRVKDILRSSLLLALSHLPVTLLMLVLNLFPLILLLFNFRLFVYVMSVWLLLGFSLAAQVNSIFLVRIFEKYMPVKEKEAEETL